mmetsp:Transcript_21336/g.43154  ORF Transcript_21336/g.43154 Transcript_21336/m.43154 type:complete len:794 (-) Transcript_21336:377-2758(-)
MPRVTARLSSLCLWQWLLAPSLGVAVARLHGSRLLHCADVRRSNGPLHRHVDCRLQLAPIQPLRRTAPARDTSGLPGPVRFVPSFKAARRARGVIDRRTPDSLSEYIVQSQTSRAEVRAMLNGLCSTGQLLPASRLLSHYLEISAGDGRATEGLASIVLNACADSGRMDLTRIVLSAMRSSRVSLGALTFCILIKGHGRAGDLRRVASTYDTMKRLRVEPDLATLNALLDAYARNGRLEEAEAVLDEMAAHAITPSARSFNTLIKGYSRSRQLSTAFRVVLRMRTALGPAGPNEVTFSTLIHACVRHGQLERARKIVSWMATDATHLTPDVWAYTALMRGLLVGPSPGTAGPDVGGADAAASGVSRDGGSRYGGGATSAPVREAVSLLKEMLSLGVRPNEATVSTLLNGCFAHGNVSAARVAADTVRAHAESEGDGALIHAVDSAMIVGLCRASQASEPRERRLLREALDLFVSLNGTAEGGGGVGGTAEGDGSVRGRSSSSTAMRGMPVMGTRTCNALLSGLVSAGETSSAVRVLQAMDRGQAEPPNGYSLCIMMRAYGARSDLARAEAVWRRLEGQGWVDNVALNTWLQVCLAAGSPKLALQAFQRAKVEWPSVRFDTVTFGTLINGLTRAQDGREGAQRALQLWAEMRDLKIPPDDAIVFALLNAAIRHLGVQVALRLRVEVLHLGWSARQLQRHDAALLVAMPSIAEVISDLEYWEALGVRPDATLASEQAELTLSELPDRVTSAPRDVPAEVSSAPSAEALAARPATAGEEIWERKGWNQMDGSWRAF